MAVSRLSNDILHSNHHGHSCSYPDANGNTISSSECTSVPLTSPSGLRRPSDRCNPHGCLAAANDGPWHEPPCEYTTTARDATRIASCRGLPSRTLIRSADTNCDPAAWSTPENSDNRKHAKYPVRVWPTD